MRQAPLLVMIGTALALLVAAANPARAQTLPLDAFFGTFEGTGLARSDVSDYFGLTVRDLDVTIGPAAGGGLTIAWTTVIRSGGDPDNPNVRRKSASVTFTPSERPGIYRATDASDVLGGGSYAWAYVDGYSLVVHSLSVPDGGAYVMQTYKRTLSDLGMSLEFTSVRDGETLRRVEGRLTKRSR